MSMLLGGFGKPQKMDLPLPYDRPDGRGEMQRAGRGSGEPGRRIYVGNLSWQTTWQDLKDHFKQAGEVLYADVLTSSDGRSRGCGVVEFATADQVWCSVSQAAVLFIFSIASFYRLALPFHRCMTLASVAVSSLFGKTGSCSRCAFAHVDSSHI